MEEKNQKLWKKQRAVLWGFQDIAHFETMEIKYNK